HSALALVEQTTVLGPFDPITWSRPTTTCCDLRHIHRFPRGTLYATVVDDVRRLLHDPALYHRTTLICDATGLGGPFLEILRASHLAAPIVPIVITGAQSPAKPGSLSVPKADLIGALSYRLHSNSLRIPHNLPQLDLLYHELHHFRTSTSSQG